MIASRKARPAKDTKPARREVSGPAAMSQAINQVIDDTIGAPAPSAGSAAAKAKPANKPKPRTREGKKGLVIYVDPEVTVALRKLAANHDTDQQTLALKGLELLFKEYGMTMPRSAAKAAARA